MVSFKKPKKPTRNSEVSAGVKQKDQVSVGFADGMEVTAYVPGRVNVLKICWLAVFEDAFRLCVPERSASHYDQFVIRITRMPPVGCGESPSVRAVVSDLVLGMDIDDRFLHEYQMPFICCNTGIP